MKISIKILVKKLTAVKKIAKITKAMRIIAITKAKKEANKLTNFSLALPIYQEIFQQLQYLIEREKSSLISSPNQQKKLWLIFTSDLGFCSFYNTKIFKIFLNNFHFNDLVIVVGNKGIKKLQFENIPIFRKYSSQVFLETALSEIITYVLANINLQFTTFQIIYTPLSTDLKFLPQIITLLPIVAKNHLLNKEKASALFITEGSPFFIYQQTIALYLQSVLYFYYLNARASEEKARQFAMNNASENAKEMMQMLKLKYNQLRQEKITREILDLSQGV